MINIFTYSMDHAEIDENKTELLDVPLSVYEYTFWNFEVSMNFDVSMKFEFSLKLEVQKFWTVLPEI